MGIAPWGEIQGGSCTLKPIFPNPATRTYSITSFSLPHHSGKDILKTNGEIRLLDISREGEEEVAIPLLYPLQGGRGTQHPLHGAALPTPGCPQSHWCATGDQQLCTGNTPEGSSPSTPTHFGVEKHLMAGCHRGVPIPHCGIYLPSMTSTPVPWENTPLPSHPGKWWIRINIQVQSGYQGQGAPHPSTCHPPTINPAPTAGVSQGQSRSWPHR